MNARLSVIGIGNSILSDEGAGLHMARRLEKRWSFTPRVDFCYAETAGLGISEVLAGYSSVILLDTAFSRQDPGSVIVFDKQQLLQAADSPAEDGHALGLKKGLEFSRLTGTLPEDLLLVAIVPAVIAYGECLSEIVEKSMSHYEDVVLGCLKRFGVGAQRKKQ